MPISHSIAKMLVAARWPLLAIAIVLAAVAFRPAGRLDFDRSIESMFPADSELIQNYERLKRTFGGNEIVLAVYVDEQLLAPDGEGIKRLKDLRQQVEQVPDVRAVLSLDQLLDGEDIVSEDNLVAENLRELFAGYTHSRDGTVAALVCMLEPLDGDDAARQETLAAIREIVAPLPAGQVAGEPAMISEGFQLIEADGVRLAIWSTVLLAIVILVFLRSLRWVLIPILVVQWTILLTRASLVWSGVRLSMVSSMLTAIVTVVGVATVIHIAVRYRQAREAGRTPREALIAAGTLLAAPIFWACATDAVGFASLLGSRVLAVQDFGVMMAIGALLVLPAVALIVPALALFGSSERPSTRQATNGRIDRGLARLVETVDRWPALVAVTGLALLVFAGFGIARLEVETDFTRNFHDTSRIVQAYDFIETRLGGAGVFDVMLPAPERLNWEYLRRVQRLQQRLRDEVVVRDEYGRPLPGLTKVISLSDAVTAGSPVNLDDVRPIFLRDRLARAGLRVLDRRLPEFVAALHAPDVEHPDRHLFRVMLRARERQPAAEKERLIEQVEAIVADELRQPDWQPVQEPDAVPNRQETGTVTGYFVLLTQLIGSIIADQWFCFGLASAGIALMMLIAFRNPLLAAVALVPNALPIVVVLGAMGWLGLKMNMGAAMIAAVSMGLSVDSSIHYITTYRRARLDGRAPRDAVRESQHTVGRAIVFSTCALIVGFGILMTSEFIPTVYFGLLVSFSMLGGLVGNLLALPLLLLLVDRRGVKSTGSS